MTEPDEQILARMAEAAAALAETGDPLMRGQYRHLLGRIAALLTIRQYGMLADADREERR
jgi:hypothetical protein